MHALMFRQTEAIDSHTSRLERKIAARKLYPPVRVHDSLNVNCYDIKYVCFDNVAWLKHVIRARASGGEEGQSTLEKLATLPVQERSSKSPCLPSQCLGGCKGSRSRSPRAASTIFFASSLFSCGRTLFCRWDEWERFSPPPSRSARRVCLSTTRTMLYVIEGSVCMRCYARSRRFAFALCSDRHVAQPSTRISLFCASGFLVLNLHDLHVGKWYVLALASTDSSLSP